MSDEIKTMTIKVIVTGATGMVGEGVLHECLLHPDVEEVLVLGRRSCGKTHPKLKEIVHGDFYNLSAIEKHLKGYDACFFCLGTTSVGKSEEQYYKISYALTMHIATILCKHNPEMTFCFISGAGTDSTEKGRLMWARVKGKTENDLMKLSFKQVFAFRPGMLKPTKGSKNTPGYYKYLGWLYYPLRSFLPQFVSTISELGLAMINSVRKGYDKQVLEVRDIVELSKRI
jgi:hypothetical protein